MEFLTVIIYIFTYLPYVLIVISLAILLWPKFYNKKGIFSLEKMIEKRANSCKPESMSDAEKEECLNLINQVNSTTINLVVKNKEICCIPGRKDFSNAKKILRHLAELCPVDEMILDGAEHCRVFVKNSAKRRYCGGIPMLILFLLVAAGLFFHNYYQESDSLTVQENLLQVILFIIPLEFLYVLAYLRPTSIIARQIAKGKDGFGAKLKNTPIFLLSGIGSILLGRIIIKETDFLGTRYYEKYEPVTNILSAILFLIPVLAFCLIAYPFVVAIAFFQNYIIQ